MFSKSTHFPNIKGIHHIYPVSIAKQQQNIILKQKDTFTHFILIAFPHPIKCTTSLVNSHKILARNTFGWFLTSAAYKEHSHHFAHTNHTVAFQGSMKRFVSLHRKVPSWPTTTTSERVTKRKQRARECPFWEKPSDPLAKHRSKSTSEAKHRDRRTAPLQLFPKYKKKTEFMAEKVLIYLNWLKWHLFYVVWTNGR